MACRDLKISEMKKADHLHGHDLIPIVQHGKNRVIDVQDLVDLFKRILPPPCPPKPHCDPWHEPHHGPHCDPFYEELDHALLHKIREDAAIAKASATTVEGKLAATQRTAEVSLDASQKALNAVRLFKSQLGAIKQIIAEQQYLKAEVRNNRSKINNLRNFVLLLAERIKELELKNGIEFQELNLEGDSWIDDLQDPFDSDCHHHHHHHHYDFDDDDDVDPTIPGDDGD